MRVLETMGLGFNVFVCFVCIIFVGNEISANPFLYSAPKAIADLVTSASASSSSPDEPYTNIADLTKKKSAQLQEKQDTSQDENPEDEKKDKPSNTETDVFEDDPLPPDVTNEAIPSFLSKKVNKILGKLKFLASLSVPVDDMKTSNEEFEEFDVDSDDDTTEKMDDPEGAKAKEMNARNVLPVLRIRTETPTGLISGLFSGYKYMEPKNAVFIFRNSDREPLKGEDDNDDNEDIIKPDSRPKKVKKAALQDNDPGNEDKTKFNLNPQSLGIYFMELIASAVSLAYGAIAQFQNSGNRPS